ncbi:MAG: ABC transporter substrate-binding protein [Lachnospiraceae bacterium]|nr:ABC transporter substrate-binding protein [Lachnospiraceae bacterium]
MKFKKLVSVLLASVMALSLVACGSEATDDAAAPAADTEAPAADAEADAEADADADAAVVEEPAGDLEDGTLVIWTLANDLKDFAARYQEKTGHATEVVVIEPADYVTKVQTAIQGGETEPDIIVGEPQMLGTMEENGFFADLNALGAQNYADQIVDYVWEVGQDADGIQRAISYQITPAGIYYRRDIADAVFGFSDPDSVGALFKDYPTILDTAEKLKAAGYRIFASDSEISYFSGDTAWVVDGALNVDQSRFDYMDLVVSLYQNDLTAYANQWSTPWYQAMAGPVPILTADIQNYADDSVNVWDAEQFATATADYDTCEVFAFGLPAWGVLTMRDNYKDTEGKWGVCPGPAYGFGGGTFIGISALSEKPNLAWDFVKFCTLNEETADWWIEFSKGDTVSLKSALEKHKDDTNPVYGDQKMYAMWLQLAEGIDYSKVTQYDTIINDAWGLAIASIKTGQASKEDALNTFYDTVESSLPEITVTR